MVSASIKFLTSRARVPGDSSLSLDREMAFVRTCARLRWRAHESISTGLNRTRTPPVIPSDATSSRVGNWRRTIERTTYPVALVRRLFSRGQRLIVNLFRPPFSTAGKSFLRVAFVNDSRQSPNRIARAFSLSPVLSLPTAHVVNSSVGVQSHGTKNLFQIRQEFCRG